MSILDEMRKRIQSNNSNATSANSTLDEMRKRVESQRKEIEENNKKVQEYNQFISDSKNMEMLKNAKPLTLSGVNNLKSVQELRQQNAQNLSKLPTAQTIAETRKAEEEYNNLSNTEKIGYKLNKYVAEPVASFLLGAGEGAGGGGITKIVQNSTLYTVALSEALKEYTNSGKSLMTTQAMKEIEQRGKEIYEEAKNDLPSAEENINDLYERFGNHQTARQAGNIGGSILAGTTLTSMGMPSAIAYGGLAGLKTYGQTDDVADIAVNAGIGAMFGAISQWGTNAIKNVLSNIPATNTQLVSNFAKNFIAGGGGMYTAGAVTSEIKNLYNKFIRDREVSDDEWLSPVWGNEALLNFTFGGIFGGISGTAKDIVNAKNQAIKDYYELGNNLRNKNNEIINALKNSDLSTAQRLFAEGQQAIDKFVNTKYLGLKVNPNAKVTLDNLWGATAYESSINYRPNMIGTNNGSSNTASSNLVSVNDTSSTNTNSNIANNITNANVAKQVSSGINQVLRNKYSYQPETNKNSNEIKVDTNQKNINNNQLIENSEQSSFSMPENTFDVTDIENLNNAQTLFYSTRKDGQYYVQATDGSGKITYDGVFYDKKQLSRSLGEKIAERIVDTSSDSLNEIHLRSNKSQNDTDYMMAHRPTETGAYASNISHGLGEWKDLMPEDVYEHPEWYFDMRKEYSKESYDILKEIKDNPDAEVTIYRATTGNKINSGDWVTLSKKYAEYHNDSQFGGKGNVVSLNVKASDIQYAGDDINEFGYFPQNEESSNQSSFSMQQNNKIQGLEDYTEQDIKDIVSDHIQDLVEDLDIKGISIHGSRARGDSKDTSDLDVVVEYAGDYREDDLFNILNEEPLEINGIKVDINPITADKSGTLEEYMERSNEYDDNKLFRDILDQLDEKEIAKEENRLFVEKYGDDATDMDWSDYSDEFRDKATEIVYNRFVNSEEGKNYIKQFQNNTLDKNNSSNETQTLFNAVKEYEKAKDKVSRSIIETITDSINIPLKSGAEYVYNTELSRKSGNNVMPTIIDINDIFEGVTKNNAIKFRKKAIEKCLELFRNKVITIKDTNTLTEINKNGIKETYSKGVDTIKIQSTNNLGDIIAEGIYKYTTRDIDNDDGILYHNFYSPVSYNGKNHLMRVIIKEFSNNPNMNDKFYYHSLELIEDINKDGDSFLPRKSGSKTVESPSSITSILPQNENYVNKKISIKDSLVSNTNKTSETDNQGRELSKEQQEFFKDSKVRDENGNLLVLHHGTDADFTTFVHEYIGEDNKDGLGFYFTANNLQFEYDYPKTVYANIINPATDGNMIDKIITREEELLETKNDKKKILLQIQKEFGVDGIIDKSRGNIVAFFSEQIKSIDNPNPTDNTDIYKSKKVKSNEEVFTSSSYLKGRVKEDINEAFNILKENEDVYKVFGNQLQSVLKTTSNRIELLIKLGALTDEKINSIVEELSQSLVLDKEGNENSLRSYIKSEYKTDYWKDISKDLTKGIKEIKDEFIEKLDKSGISSVVKSSKEEAIKVMKGVGIEQKTIESFLDGYANEYERNLYSNILDEFIYYSRSLEEIEKTNYAETQKTNYLLNKRRWDYLHSANEKTNKRISLADIRKEVEKSIGKNVRLKGFRERAYGIYNPNFDEIRVKNISDIDTIVHEFGHRIDFKELKKAVNEVKGMDKELKQLCARQFRDAYADNEDVALKEGWAEFTRRFIENNEQTIKEYPIASRFLQEQMEGKQNLKNTILNLINMSEDFVHASSEAVASGLLSVGEETDKLKDATSVFDKFMYNVYDDLWYIRKLTNEYAKSQGNKIYNMDPNENLYNLMRLNKKSEDRTINIIKYGFYDDLGNKVTRGLGEILEPFQKSKETMAQIRQLLLARRTLDYSARGLESGFSIPDAINTITNISDRDILNAVQEIEEFANRPFEMALENGLISKSDYKEIKKWNKYYVPLKRVFEGQQNIRGSNKTSAGGLVQKRTGSMRNVIDPLESIVQNTVFMMDKIAHNNFVKTLVDFQNNYDFSDLYHEIPIPMQLQAQAGMETFKGVLQEQLGVNPESLGIDFDVVKNIFSPKLSDDRTKTITYMDDGKIKAVQFYDDNLYKVFAGGTTTSNIVSYFKTLENITGILRSGATAMNVEFAIPNMISDTFVAWIYSDNGFIPAVDTARGMVDYFIAEYNLGDNNTENKKLYSYYKQSGASMATRVGTYRTEVQEYLKEAIGKHVVELQSNNTKTFKSAMKSILNGLGKMSNGVQDLLSIFPELSEQATRFEYFKKSYNNYIKKGYSHKQAQLQAGIDTKDSTMDFNRAGEKMRGINRLYAFANASVQGTYRAIEGIQKAPKKVIGRTLLLTFGYLILKSIFGGDDKELEEVAEQTKKDNYILKFGDKVIKIKKPQDFFARNVINFADTLYDVVSGNTTDYEKEWKYLAEDFINSLSFIDIDSGKDAFSNIAGNVVPTGIEPIVEAGLDTDFYYGSQITAYGKENLSPKYQYNEYTSKSMILLGQLLNLSPDKLEHVLTGYGAGVAQQMLDFADSIIDAFSDDITLPTKADSEKFISRRFVVDPNKNSQSVSDVYELYDTLNTKNKDSKINGESLTKNEQETFEKLDKAMDIFSRINKELKEVQSSLTLNADAKRAKIDKLKALRTDVARYYLDKPLINSSNKKQIELYEYYPASTEYTYKVNGVSVKVQYDENAQKKYAQICKNEYETNLKTLKTSSEYMTASSEERKELENSILRKAKSTAQAQVSKEVYEKRTK